MDSTWIEAVSFMTETEREEISALREACVDAREIAERSIRARQEAEVALGTLQTALRERVAQWRALVMSSAAQCCADELETLLPALEPTP